MNPRSAVFSVGREHIFTNGVRKSQWVLFVEAAEIGPVRVEGVTFKSEKAGKVVVNSLNSALSAGAS